MTGVEYIQAIGEDTQSTKSKTKISAKDQKKSKAVYALSLDGISLVEGEGSLERATGIIFADHGKKYTGAHQSGPIVSLKLALNPHGKVQRAIRFVSTKEESKKLEKEMHAASDFIKKRGDKASELLDLWIQFCARFKISEQTFKTGADFTSSAFDMFSDLKRAYKKGRNLGNVTKDVIDEIEDALGYPI